jgi:hypothetical protein
MMNVGRCTRCGAFLIEEESESHKCEIRVKEVKDIYFQWITDGITNKNGDLERTGLAFDGTLYGLYLCEHNPPCSTKRKFTGEKPNEDLTEPLSSVYIGVCYFR